jgi:hypothetical protein
VSEIGQVCGHAGYGHGIFRQLAGQFAGVIYLRINSNTENKRLFLFGTPFALYLPRTRWSGPTEKSQGVITMFTATSIRETVTIFAGAFLTALLLVSAATSPLIA